MLFKFFYLPLAVLALAWGVLSFLQADQLARAGYSLSRGHLVVRVVPGSPAEQAGLRVGDSIIGVDGTGTRDRWAVERLSRGAIGDVRRLDVQRGEESLSVDIRLAGFTKREIWRRHAGTFTGLCYLVIAGLAWVRRPSPASRALAVMGLGLGLAFMGPGGQVPEAWRLAASLARNALILAGIGSCLYFLRLMVAERGPAGPQLAGIFAPLAVFWLLLAVRTVHAEDTPNLVKGFTGFMGGLLFGVYLALAIATLLRAWVRGRQAGGNGPVMRLLCLGPLLGLVPVAAAALLPVLWPGVALPGMDFWFLSLLLVPLAWSAAAVTCKV